MTLNPTSNDIYFALVRTAFAGDGPLAQALARRGRRYRINAAQADYADRVSQLFALGRNAAGGSIGALEGECGIGKTLGYMVPMAIFCAVRGARGIVALPAEAITDPHYLSELAVAIEVAQELTGKGLTMVSRFAPSDFLSRAKIAAFRAGLARREDIDVAMACLERSCGERSLLPDVRRDHGPLPAAVRVDDICGDERGAAYKAHLAASAKADILLATHDLIRDGMAGCGNLAWENFGCGVIDEADLLPRALAGRGTPVTWRLPNLEALCLTGAALSPDGHGSDIGFRAFRDRLGLGPDVNFREDLSGRFSPQRFGSLTFNLSHPHAPRPTVDGEELSKDNARNPHWYDYVEGVLAEVAEFRQRTLVLTCHHKDTSELARRLRVRKLTAIDYGPGDRLEDVVAAFTANPAAILIGANLWERVNLPGLVRHLVVTRLPIGMRSSEVAEPLPEGLKAQEIERQRLVNLMQEARRKVRLGIGRAVRTAGDDAHVWITDPRFPLPGSLSDNPRLQLPAGDPHYKAFATCIPERFRSGLFATWPQATLIAPDTRAAEAENGRPARRQARH